MELRAISSFLFQYQQYAGKKILLINPFNTASW